MAICKKNIVTSFDFFLVLKCSVLHPNMTFRLMQVKQHPLLHLHIWRFSLLNIILFVCVFVLLNSLQNEGYWNLIQLFNIWGCSTLTEGFSYALFILSFMRLHAYPKVLEWSDLLGFFCLSSPCTSLPPFVQVGFFHCLWEGLVLKYLFLQFLV